MGTLGFRVKRLVQLQTGLSRVLLGLIAFHVGGFRVHSAWRVLWFGVLLRRYEEVGFRIVQVLR